MKAAMLTKTGFEIRDVPMPEYGAHQVLVKLIGTGVCSGEPVACCVHAMQRCRISGGEEVALVGCGFMGLICMELARIHGCGFAANIGHAYSLREHPDIRRLMMQAILWNAKVDDD